MTFRAQIRAEKRRTAQTLLAFLILVTAVLAGTYAHAADEPDLIFRRSTVFKLLTPNDKLATYGVDDPEIEGVACHFTLPEKGGIKGWLGVAEEVSDISLACRQMGPIRFKENMKQGEDMFRQRRSLLYQLLKTATRSNGSSGDCSRCRLLKRNTPRILPG